jgi:copper chaperone CopZ
MNMNKKISIQGMTCGHCASRVEKALEELECVKSAKVNLEGNYAIADLSCEVEDSKLIEAVDDAGYDVTGIE